MTKLLWQRAATELSALISTGEVSAREVIDAHLDRIEEVNCHCNAVTVVLADQARAEATAADKKTASHEAVGPLHGVPFTIKENLDLAGTPTTQGLPAFAGLVAPTDAPLVERLRAAGAIPIGRTNLPELGLRITTDNPLHGLTRNPWHPSRTAGGSSGGEGSAIAAGMSPLGLGNDIGGSLRNPAFCCGITALKPSHGRLPAFSSFEHDQNRSLAQQVMATDGPMARSVADLRKAMEVLHGRDPRDNRSVTVPLDGPPIGSTGIPRRAAVLREIPGVDIHPSVIEGVDQAAKALDEAGWEVVAESPPEISHCTEIWAHLLAADIGDLLKVARPLLSDGLATVLEELSERFSPAVMASGLVHQEVDRLGREWSLFFAEHPVLIMPTWTQPQPEHGFDLIIGNSETTTDLVRCITPPNLLGLPSVAVPTGVTNGLPVGVQCAADRWRDDLALLAAADIEATLGTFTPIDPVTT